MGRRVKKTVYAYGSGAWELEKEILFVYDGWNLIQEKEVSATGDPLFDNFYVWGLDLSQSLQGAGGIGGLVCRVSGGEVRHYFYDANGNVGQLVDPEDGAVTARYEYDPFGNGVFVDGADAAGNTFRFSTKLFIGEIGGYDFGLRVYLPKLGRWTSRDPIGEQGGYNLYVFIKNTGINSIDPTGETDYRGYPVTDGEKNHIYLPRFKDQLSPEILITNIVIDAFNEILWITQNGTFRSEVDALLFAAGTPMLSAEVKAAGQSAITVIDYSQSIVHKLYLFYKCGDDIVPIEGKIASKVVEDFAPKSVDDFVLDSYGRLSRRTDIPGQAHHLNQTAAYRDIIPKSQGVSTKIEGNILTEAGSPHNRAHQTLENFWNEYRGTDIVPTNLDYTKALQNSLRSAGLPEAQVQQAVRIAIRERVQAGALGGMEVPRVPRPIRNMAQ